MTLRVGVVGAGYVAQIAHIANLVAYERCRVVALAELRPQLGRLVAERYGIEQVYDNHRELIGDPEIDAVVAVTMRPATGPVALDALTAGKHVLSEKPMAHTIEQAARLVDAARAFGARYAIGFMKRHDPGVVRARDLIREIDASGEYGKLQRIAARSLHGDVMMDASRTLMTSEPRPGGLEEWPVAPEWMPPRKREGYAAFLNVHGHLLNLLRFLREGDAVAVARAGAPNRSIDLRIGGVPARVELRDASDEPWTEDVEFVYEAASVRIVLPAPFDAASVARCELRTARGVQIVEPHALEWAFARQARAFVDDVLDDREPRASGADAARDLAIAEDLWRLGD